MRIRFLRGSTNANNIHTGYDGEITIDREAWNIRLHDGVTPGGHVAGGNLDGISTQQFAAMGITYDKDLQTWVLDEGTV